MTQLLDQETVCERTTFSPRQLHRRVKERDFPEPLRISPGRVAWLEEAVEGWIRAKADMRSSDPGVES